MCGENQSRESMTESPHGSPPRMRGKHALPPAFTVQPRITPAHAGKTKKTSPPVKLAPDHPRACGENVDMVRDKMKGYGSPPRMRGKRLVERILAVPLRITPAHAGKTRVSIHSQNLLHSGSPPRVRGNSTTFLCTKSITSSVRNFRLNQHFCFLHIQTKQKVFRVNQRAINAWR